MTNKHILLLKLTWYELFYKDCFEYLIGLVIFEKNQDSQELLNNIDIDLKQKILSLPRVQSKITTDFIKTLPKET